MDKQNIHYSRDLSDVVVGDTAISDVRGHEGILSYRGINIDQLTHKPFFQVVWMVLFGTWPDAREERQLNEFMAYNSRLSEAETALLKRIPKDVHPMLMLQGVIPLLSLPSDATMNMSLDAERGLTLAAKISGLIAGHFRLSQNKDLSDPVAGASFHESFLTRFNGHAPSEDQVRMLDTAQILQMEHSFNCGTFAGRICASSLAPIQACISASIGALFGKLHGGADQAALEMAAQIGRPENARSYVRETLANKRKIMGMGHREYRTIDPRARILKPMAEQVCKNGEAEVLLSTLIAVEEACQEEFAQRGKQIWANVEFYKGAVFHSMGIPSQYFTAMFSMARVYGYIAHYLEFSQDSCLIRPKARYTA